MTGEEVRKVFSLMEQYWPNAKPVREPLRRKAWGTVLERYGFEEVRGRVFDLAATSKYCPDLSEFTEGLAQEGPARLTGGQGATKPMPRNAHRPATPFDREQQAELVSLRATAGGPCPILAKAAGTIGETFARSGSGPCGGCGRADRECSLRDYYFPKEATS